MGVKLRDKDSTFVHIIDVQQSLMAKIHKAEKVAGNVAFLCRCAGAMNIPMVANTQYKKGLGPYVDEVESLIGDTPVFDKTEFNALANVETAKFVDNLSTGKTSVILAGVETHICVYQTAVGYLERKFDVWVLSDAVSSRSEENHLDGLSRLRDLGVTVGSVEMFIYELLGKAGTTDFKKVLPLILAKDV